MSEHNDDTQQEPASGTAHPVDEAELNSMNEEGAAVEPASEPTLEEKYAQLEKDHLYLRAEMDNIKRQSIKERSSLLKYGAERLARDLLDTLDVFHTAFATEITDQNFENFVNGIKMTRESLTATLKKHGIEELDCIGKAFDPNTQEALSSEPKEDIEEGHVTQVFKAPYMYHDKLLRPGQVIVSSGKPQ